MKNRDIWTIDWRGLIAVTTVLLLVSSDVLSQSTGTQTADLITLGDKVASPDTRIRVDALHRVWRIGSSAVDPSVKLRALQLLAEPAGSASDHIRMPAVYAIAEIANSTQDTTIKIRALELLGEPLRASQVPIREVAIDAVNSITGSAPGGEVALAAVKALGEPVRSGNNGVRIPAILAMVRAVKGSHNEAAYQAALDTLRAPLESAALVGGMEVRMLAVLAVERIGVDSSDTETKGIALGSLRSYAGKSSWEPEAKRLAEEASIAVQNSMKKTGD